MRWSVAFFALVLAGCSSGKATTASSSEPSSTDSAAPRMARRAGSSSADPPALPPGAPDATSFGCGPGRCAAGAETCCNAGSKSGCVKTVAPGPDEAVDAFTAQRAACAKVTGDEAGLSLSRCDESDDCGDGSACCHERMLRGEATVCVAVKNAAEATCSFEERCISGGKCRTPGAVCVDGVCAKEKISCGKKGSCSGDTPACCGDPPTCRAASACEDAPRYRCLHPSDCLAGQRCLESAHGTYCGTFVDPTRQRRTVCDSSADCPRLLECPSPKCSAGEGLPFKFCECH